MNNILLETGGKAILVIKNKEPGWFVFVGTLISQPTWDVEDQTECGPPNQDVQGQVAIGKCKATAVSLYTLCRHVFL